MKAARRVRATSSRHATSRGQRRQPTTTDSTSSIDRNTGRGSLMPPLPLLVASGTEPADTAPKPVTTGGAVAADGGREGQEMSRRIREELERIRDAESRVEDALESVRQARRRVEVIARDLGREELRVRALVRE